MSSANRIKGRIDYGGVLLVPIELNNFSLRFMVDTGAAFSAINRRLLDKIVAEPSDYKISVAPVGKKIVTLSTLKIDSFRVGSMLQKNMLVAIIDFPENVQIGGLLGMNFLRNYRITIETDTATLILREIPKKK